MSKVEKGVTGGVVMAVRTEKQDSETSIVRVQVLIIASGIRLVKRFAEAIRDSARADALLPILPNITDIDNDNVALEDVKLVRISVFVPAFSSSKVKAYARILRNASRSGMPLPKFTLTTSRQEVKAPALDGTGANHVSKDTESQNSVDMAKLREVMRNAREARYV